MAVQLPQKLEGVDLQVFVRVLARSVEDLSQRNPNLDLAGEFQSCLTENTRVEKDKEYPPPGGPSKNFGQTVQALSQQIHNVQGEDSQS